MIDKIKEINEDIEMEDKLEEIRKRNLIFVNIISEGGKNK